MSLVAGADLLTFCEGNATESTLFGVYATVVTRHIELYCGRGDIYDVDGNSIAGFESADKEEYVDGSGDNMLKMRRYPITEITHVKPEDPQDTYTAISSDWYRSLGRDAIGGIITASPDYGYIFVKGHLNYKVQYTAGFATVPTDLQEAAKEWVKHMYEMKNATHTASSQNLGGQSSSMNFDNKSMPEMVKRLLSHYRDYKF